MIIDCVSDLHGEFPELEGGDLLIIAGDCTSNDRVRSWQKFFEWLEKQKYRKKVMIAGNHDNFCKHWAITGTFNDDTYQEIYPGEKPTIDYLCDSGIEFEGLKIWGTPWSLWFDGINPHCKAFTGSERQLAAKYELIPDDTDILISHGPSWGHHDSLYRSNERVGSPALTNWIARHVNTLKLFVCGHIHEGYGIYDVTKLQDEIGDKRTTVFVNAAHMNADYEPVNKPIRVIL